MSNDHKEEYLRRKYSPTPEDAPRHKKRTKRRDKKSNHKHEYEDVAVYSACSRREFYHEAKRCKICGKIYTISFFVDHEEPPEGMRAFDSGLEDMWSLYKMGYIPDEMEIE